MSIVTVSDMPVTLITGGGSGIGAAATRRLLAAGGRVTITGRDPARLEKFAAEAPGHDRLLTVVADASEPEPVEAAVAATVERFGRLDHVVANAGLSTHDTIAEGDPARWREMVRQPPGPRGSGLVRPDHACAWKTPGVDPYL